LRLHRAGIPMVLVERGDLAATIRDWPPGTKMFSPQARVAVGDLPFPPALANREHLTREQYTGYLGDAVRESGLSVLARHEVVSIRQDDPGFTVGLRAHGGEAASTQIRCGHIVFATGCMHAPVALGVPGENLPFVRNLPGLDFDAVRSASVCVVGGRHSAVEASLRFVDGGSTVTLVYRRKHLYQLAIKSWLYDELTRRIEEGRIRFFGSTEVTGFGADGRVSLRSKVEATPAELRCDLALVACGFTYDATLMGSVGVATADRKPSVDAASFESNVRDVFVVGTAVAGQQQSGYTHDIDNVSGHGSIVANEIRRRLGSRN
jgi:thioredoxin reductase (NADPH)